MSWELDGYIIEEHYDRTTVFDELVGISAHKDFPDGSFDVMYESTQGEPGIYGYTPPSMATMRKRITERTDDGIIRNHYSVIISQFPEVDVSASAKAFVKGNAQQALELLNENLSADEYSYRVRDWVESLRKHLTRITKAEQTTAPAYPQMTTNSFQFSKLMNKS